jgi:hypothetical protein
MFNNSAFLLRRRGPHFAALHSLKKSLTPPPRRHRAGAACLVTGALATAFMGVLKGPPSNTFTAVGAQLVRVLPHAAAVGAVFTLGSAATAEVLGEAGARSQAAGGMLAGVTVLGSQYGLQRGFLGGLAAVGVVGVAHLFQKLGPDAEMLASTRTWQGVTAGSRNFPNPNLGPEEAGFAAAGARGQEERVRALVGGQRLA